MRIIFKIFIYIVLIYNSSFSQSRENLGSAINSICNEISPILSPDGLTLYLCRSYCRGNIGNEDIWIAQRDENYEWERAKNAGKTLNIGKSNFVTSIFANGNKLLLGTAFDENGQQIQGASVVSKTDNGWSKPININIKNFKNHSKTNGFFISNDSKILLMTINKEDSYGEKDIYVSFLENDYNYTEPYNLGDLINSNGDEISPFLANDGVTLYFSSDGRGGFGNADVFMATRLDDTWMNWSEPINLGPEINTSGWDAFFKLKSSGMSAYYTSNYDTYGESDIFFVKLPKKIRPKNVSLVKGYIKDAKNLLPLNVKIDVFKYPEEIIFKTLNNNNQDGYYEFSVPIGDIWKIVVNCDEYRPQDVIIDLSNHDSYSEFIRDFNLTLKWDTLFTIKNLLFEYAKTETDLIISDEFNIIAKFLQQNENYNVEIIGHTDSIGKPQVNKRISLERAMQSAKILEKLGINKDRITVVGQSYNNPIAPNSTEEGRALNRRVEFYLRKKQQ